MSLRLRLGLSFALVAVTTALVMVAAMPVVIRYGFEPVRPGNTAEPATTDAPPDGSAPPSGAPSGSASPAPGSVNGTLGGSLGPTGSPGNPPATGGPGPASPSGGAGPTAAPPTTTPGPTASDGVAAAERPADQVRGPSAAAARRPRSGDASGRQRARRLTAPGVGALLPWPWPGSPRPGCPALADGGGDL
jgi:hypothetical protein